MIQELPEYNVGDFYSGPLSEINHQFHKNGKKITLYRRTQKEDNRIRRTDWAFDPDDTRDYDRRGDKDLPGPRILHELTTRIDPKKIANEEIIRQHANQVGIDTEDNDPVHWKRKDHIMTRAEIEKGVRGVLGDSLGIDENSIFQSSNLKKDLGAESIDFIDIVFRLEREFDFRIVRGELFSDADIDSKFDFPVSMIADFVEKKLNEKH